MKIIALVISLLSLTILSLQAQDNKDIISLRTYFDKTQETVKEIFYVLKSDTTIKHGVYQHNFPYSDNVKLSGNYDKGLQHGIFTWYYESGQKKIEEQFEYGKRINTYTKWFRTGEIEIKGHYQDNLLIDSLVQYYPSGQIKTITYFKDGKRNGHMWQYYADGKKLARYTMKDDAMNGPFQSWERSGIIAQKGQYVNDSLTGLVSSYQAGILRKLSTLDRGVLIDTTVVFYEDGETVYSQIPFQKGKEHGWIQTFHKNKQPQKKVEYKLGKPTGNQFEFHPNGTISKEIFVKESGLVTFTNYAENGTKIRDGQTKYGKAFGDHKTYYASAGLRSLYAFKNGKKTGEGFEYYEDGNVKEKWNFQGSKKKRIAYHSNKHKAIIESWNNGKPEGTWEYYYSNGQDSLTYSYDEAGKKHGLMTIYYTDGTIQQKTPWEHGKRLGTEQTFYPNGQLHQEFPHNGKGIYGKVFEYYQNGNLKATGKQYLHKKMGVWEYYNDQGFLNKKETYKKGVLMNTKEKSTE